MFRLISDRLTQLLAETLILALGAGVALAQTRPPSDSEGEAQAAIDSSRAIALLAASAAQGGLGSAQNNDAASSSQPDPATAPQLAMFPHPEDARYWLSGQANIIYQGRIPFHSLYQGTNSFHNSAEYKTSMVGTA